MRRLAAHFGRFRSEFPKDQLLIVFDIDGTILDIRHIVRRVCCVRPRLQLVHGLTADDVIVDEARLTSCCGTWRSLPPSRRGEPLVPRAALAGQGRPRRPSRVPGLLRDPVPDEADTSVALDTGRPSTFRRRRCSRSTRSAGVPGRVLLGVAAMNPRASKEGSRDEGGGAGRVRAAGNRSSR